MTDKGMTINQAIREYDNVELLQYLQEEIVDKGNHEKVMEMDVDDNDYYYDECTT